MQMFQGETLLHPQWAVAKFRLTYPLHEFDASNILNLNISKRESHVCKVLLQNEAELGRVV